MNTDISRISKSQKRAIAIATLALALLAISLLAFSCASTLPAEDVEENGLAATYQVSNPSPAVGIAENAGTALGVETNDAAKKEASRKDDSMTFTDTAQQASSNAGPANDGSRPSGSGSDTASAETSAPKRWVDDTEQVWVVDRQAWSESVPVYSTTEVSICNICGADITGNTSAHGKTHMKAGEGSGHHSEVRQSITGYNTINHPEEGHWETRVVGGHWG